MRISYLSSDVCSSDLRRRLLADPSAECDGQLGEIRPAPAGAHRGRSEAAESASAARRVVDGSHDRHARDQVMSALSNSSLRGAEGDAAIQGRCGAALDWLASGRLRPARLAMTDSFEDMAA